MTPQPVDRSDVLIIRRRDAYRALAIALILMVTIGPDLLRRAARPLLILNASSVWCYSNGIAANESDCSDWAHQYIAAHPSFVKECGSSIIDSEAFYGCLNRYYERNP